MDAVAAAAYYTPECAAQIRPADVYCTTIAQIEGVFTKGISNTVFSERELKFMFAICRRPSVCRLSVCRLSVCLSVVCRLSVTFVRPTQAIEIFGNIFTPFGTLAIYHLCVKILWKSSQGNPSVGGVTQEG